MCYVGSLGGSGEGPLKVFAHAKTEAIIYLLFLQLQIKGIIISLRTGAIRTAKVGSQIVAWYKYTFQYHDEFPL